MKNWIKPIKKMGACSEALEWAEDYKTIEGAWQKCERGDWMLWLLCRTVGEPESDSRKKLVLTACKCARLALPYVTKGETRPLKAIETAESWAKGESGITIKDVRIAAYAAIDAAYVAYAAYAAYVAVDAAYAAAYAAYAAAYAAYAAYAAVDAAYATVDAAVDAAYVADAQEVVVRKCAGIVREDYDAPNLKTGGR